MGPIERRHLLSDALELRALEDEQGKRSIRGYAALFNSMSEDFGGYRESIAPGAFAETVGGDVRALWSHNPDYVLGRTRSGTLRLEEDSRGLRFDLDLPDTQWGRDAYELIRRGDVSGMSFGFRIKKRAWEETDDGLVRVLQKVELLEISPTAFPAYPETEVFARSADILEDARRELANRDSYKDESRRRRLRIALARTV